MEQAILADIQSKLKAPKGQFNKFGGYKYRNCEDILNALKPLLIEHKLAIVISDELVMIGDRYYVKSTASLVSDGATLASTTGYARESESKKGMDESQITGAASSYARKYALNGLLAIDDEKDADATNKHNQDEEAKPKAPEKTKPKMDEPLSLTGIIEKVEKKTGESKGKPWTRYGIHLDGNVYGTFDSKIGKKALILEGQKVMITYEKGEKYMTCTSIEDVLEEGKEPGQEVLDGDILY